jgi:hypothetical protein
VGGIYPDGGNNLVGSDCAETGSAPSLEWYRLHDVFGLGLGVVPLPIRLTNNVPYTLAGFGVFRLTGWTTQGSHHGGTAIPDAACSVNTTGCVIGDLMRMVAPDNFPTVAGTCFGICTVKLTG